MSAGLKAEPAIRAPGDLVAGRGGRRCGTTETLQFNLCYNMVMIRVNIAEAKATLSRLLRAVRSGEAVVICDHNVPVAELRALPTAHRQKRKLGPERPGFEIPASFFEPLPGDLARAFAGENP